MKIKPKKMRVTKAKNPRIVRMTVAHKHALLCIQDGADVVGYSLARLLREVEATKPNYIVITEVMGKYNPAGQLPYFGAIATRMGVDWAKGVKS